MTIRLFIIVIVILFCALIYCQAEELRTVSLIAIFNQYFHTGEGDFLLSHDVIIEPPCYRGDNESMPDSCIRTVYPKGTRVRFK